MALSSVNVALPAIAGGLGATANDLQWVLAGYALSFGVSLIPAGRAGDVLGRGSWFVLGLALFVASSIACGLAPTPLFLNVARIVQGLGAGIFSPQVTGMIQQYFSGQGRAKAFAVFGLVISVSVAVGPIVTGFVIGALGEEEGWRWAFLINTPLGLLGLILALAWFPFETERLRRAASGGAQAPLDLDPVGTAILTVAIVCLMYPFMADTVWTWALLPVAPLLLRAWTRWERRYAASGRAPMVDMTLFAFRSFRNGMLVSGVMFLGIASTFAVTAIFLQSGLGLGAPAAGMVGLPNAVVSAYSSVWSVKHVMVRGRRLMVAMLALMVLGTVLSIVVALLVPLGAPWWLLAFTLMLNGFGMGVVGSANQTLSLEDVPPHHGGTAGGIKQTLERIGAALGNAMVTGLMFGLVAFGWTIAFAGAFGLIALFLLGSTLLAVADERHHRTPLTSPAGRP
ncbi:MAG: MFS transporter [Actinomycetes bacterium]